MCRAAGRELPFIILSDISGEETAVAAIRAGAHDFLVKGRLSQLPAAIERALPTSRRGATATGSTPTCSRRERWKRSGASLAASHTTSTIS